MMGNRYRNYYYFILGYLILFLKKDCFVYMYLFFCFEFFCRIEGRSSLNLKVYFVICKSLSFLDG